MKSVPKYPRSGRPWFCGPAVLLLFALRATDLPARIVVFNDDGGWNWLQDERVIVAGGKLVMASVALGVRDPGRKGAVEVASYDLKTGEIRKATEFGPLITRINTRGGQARQRRQRVQSGQRQLFRLWRHKQVTGGRARPRARIRNAIDGPRHAGTGTCPSTQGDSLRRQKSEVVGRKSPHHHFRRNRPRIQSGSIRKRRGRGEPDAATATEEVTAFPSFSFS